MTGFEREERCNGHRGSDEIISGGRSRSAVDTDDVAADGLEMTIDVDVSVVRRLRHRYRVCTRPSILEVGYKSDYLCGCRQCQVEGERRV